MRHAKEMQDIAYELEIRHHMTELQCIYGNGGPGMPPEERAALGESRREKIDLSDAIYVVDMNGCIGEATQREIDYAKEQGKEVILHSQFVLQDKKNEPAVTALFLGTCACDFSPRLKDEFKDCFDKDARRASALLGNDAYLIDCGPHTLDSLRIAGKSMEPITDIFITHIHYDHFTAGNIAKIAEGKKKPLRPST